MPRTKAQSLPDPVIERVSFSKLSTYGSCQTKGYLRYVLGEKPKTITAPLFVGTLFHEGCESYYKGEANSVLEGAVNALETAFKKAGKPELIDPAIEAAGIQATILDKFRSGEIVNKEGALYQSPKMTKAYKELAAKMGLYARYDKLKGAVLGDLDPEENLGDAVGRILDLAERYQSTIMYPRTAFKTLRIEEGFEYTTTLPSGRKITFVGFMDLLGEDHEGNWVLIDYKSGAAKVDTEHQKSADGSLQLTMYHKVLVDQFKLDPNKLKLALHYPDAGYEANTYRIEEDWNIIEQLADQYLDLKDKMGIPPRLFYDGPMCQGCDLRAACVGVCGMGTKAATEAMNGK